MIDSNPNLPRPGLPGVWDRLVGPAADPLENGLVICAMIAGPGLAAAWAMECGVDWAWWQWIVLCLFASDLLGGLAANAMDAGKRWHHRPGQGPREHFIYAALHAYPLILALAAPETISLRAALIVYGLLLAGAGVVIATPARLKNAVGLLLALLATVVCSLWVRTNGALGWFPGALYLKVLAGFLVPPGETSTPWGPWS